MISELIESTRLVASRFTSKGAPAPRARRWRSAIFLSLLVLGTPAGVARADAEAGGEPATDADGGATIGAEAEGNAAIDAAAGDGGASIDDGAGDGGASIDDGAGDGGASIDDGAGDEGLVVDGAADAKPPSHDAGDGLTPLSQLPTAGEQQDPNGFSCDVAAGAHAPIEGLPYLAGLLAITRSRRSRRVRRTRVAR